MPHGNLSVGAHKIALHGLLCHQWIEFHSFNGAEAVVKFLGEMRKPFRAENVIDDVSKAEKKIMKLYFTPKNLIFIVFKRSNYR